MTTKTIERTTWALLWALIATAALLLSLNAPAFAGWHNGSTSSRTEVENGGGLIYQSRPLPRDPSQRDPNRIYLNYPYRGSDRVVAVPVSSARPVNGISIGSPDGQRIMKGISNGSVPRGSVYIRNGRIYGKANRPLYVTPRGKVVGAHVCGSCHGGATNRGYYRDNSGDLRGGPEGL